jgi:uncharacterized protein
MSDIDARFSIFVAAKGMKATVDYYPAEGNGKNLKPEEILASLRESGVKSGIKEDIPAYVTGSKQPLKSVTIAEAILPGTGENARIEQYITFPDSARAQEREDGTVDFHNLGEICSVIKGEALYRKIPPTAGKPGMDIMGNEIPGIMGRDTRVVLGQGTEYDAGDPNLVVSTRDGEVVLNHGIIQISEVHTVKGDVDFSTGNIKYKGSVKVSGTVRSGFSVEAGGNVEIGENVEDSSVSSEKDVYIAGGCIGSGQGLVKAGRDVFVRFVENQSIEAQRDIIIKDVSYHAVLSAGRSILVKLGKGTIVGGQAKAKYSVEALRFGSAAGVPTFIRIGVDPKLMEKIKLIEEEIPRLKESSEKMEQSIAILNRQRIEGNGYLPQDKAELLQKLEEMRKNLPEKIENLQKERGTLVVRQEDLNNALAKADLSVFPKVRIFVESQFLAVEDKLDASIFKRVKGDLIRLSK